MAIAQPGKQYYRSLYDVYEDVHLNKRLAGIAKAWGRKDGKALSITPRVRWEPGADKFKPAEMSGEIAVLPWRTGRNEQVMIEEFDRRDARATVFLFADTYPDAERLLEKFRGALSDVLRATSVYEASEGQWIQPEDDSISTWEFRMPLTVRLVLADLNPVFLPTNDIGSLGTP